MAALQNYEGPAKLFVQARLLTEVSRSTVRVNANSNPVRTMARNLAGRSKGPIESEISLESAIPSAGFEREFHDFLASNEYQQVVLQCGGRRFEFNVWVENYEITHAVDASASYNITLMGGPPSIR